ADVVVRRQAGDQNIGLALGVHQVANVAWVDEVERAVAHDDLPGARPGTNGGDQLLARLDLAPVSEGHDSHAFFLGTLSSRREPSGFEVRLGSPDPPSISNQVRVAA